jgi:hypothetical protein
VDAVIVLLSFSVLLAVSAGIWGLRAALARRRSEQLKPVTVCERVESATHYSHYLDTGKESKNVSYWSF